MHGGAWAVLPSHNATPDATLTWAVGTANAEFPITNAKTLEPDVVAKANQSTATLRLTFGSPQALEGLALFNVNFPGVTITLTNNAGMVAQTVTVPAPQDDLQIHAFFDLAGVANTTATQWNIAVVGTVAVAIGTVVAVEAWTELRVRWGMELSQRFPVIEHRTFYQKRLQYRIPVNFRTYKGTPFYAEDRNTLRMLRREAHGSFTPFAFLPDRNDEDIALVQFTDDHSERAQFTDGLFTDDTARGVVEMPIALEEVSGGVSLL